MARITVEDCLEKVFNWFEFVMLASKRAKPLLKGAKPLLETDNREIVTALREIARRKGATPEPTRLTDISSDEGEFDTRPYKIFVLEFDRLRNHVLIFDYRAYFQSQKKGA